MKEFLLLSNLLRVIYELVLQSRAHSALAQAAGSNDDAQAVASDPALNPWPFGFQVSERNLVWSDGAQRRLLKIHAAKSLGKVARLLLCTCVMKEQVFS